MTSKHIKWIILVLPTVTVALWEYIRHQWLLPYISMEVGNWLTAVFVFVITLLFLPKLFSQLESIQNQLQEEKVAKAALQEREVLARELHDGIAQSLFLLSVKVDKLRKEDVTDEEYLKIKQTIREVNEYVRQAIANLRAVPEPKEVAWVESIRQLIHTFQEETGIPVHANWELSERRLSVRAKIELYAIIQEALQNVRKHAKAQQVWIDAVDTESGWRCAVQDDGVGFGEESCPRQNRFGLQIMKDRAKGMGWSLTISREKGKTKIEISGKEDGS